MLDIKKDYELIMNHIEGFFIIDPEEKILYMTDKLARSEGFNDGQGAIGEDIKELFDGVNKVNRVLRTHKKQIGEIYSYRKLSIVSNGFPLYIDGKLEGAMEYDAFQNEDDSFLYDFLDKVTQLTKELNFYKKEYDKDKKNVLKYTVNDIIGESDSIKKLKQKIHNVADLDLPVLIQGETGTGKELIAQSIHKLSNRSPHNFVSINCASIPGQLFESEMFGYEEGSFTGANKSGKKGKVQLANGGTLFLDEVDQLPINDQPKLLRFLQEKEIACVGSDTEIPVDVRIIAASNQNLEKLISQGKFRMDLYYRLNVINVSILPLRERKEDIPLLTNYLIDKINDKLGRVSHRVSNVDKNMMAMFFQYNWPGNVRELQNVLERAINNCYEKTLTYKYFEDSIFSSPLSEKKTINEFMVDLEEIKNNAEREAILRALDKCKGNVTKTAERLQVSRQTLYKKMKELNLVYEKDEAND